LIVGIIGVQLPKTPAYHHPTALYALLLGLLLYASSKAANQGSDREQANSVFYADSPSIIHTLIWNSTTCT
jgi:hypothetical protein